MDGAHLAAWRTEHGGISQQQLADALGVSVWTVRQWEQGRRPTPERMLNLALAELDRQLATASTSTPAS